MSHQREPVKYTCPDIDRAIRSIKSAIVKDMDLKGMDERELRETASAMSDELGCCIDYLEDLRSSNDKLRRWAKDEAERVDSLEIRFEEEAPGVA